MRRLIATTGLPFRFVLKSLGMRTFSQFCRNGHEMSGQNLIWHTRYDKETGQQSVVRECRACANRRYRTQRSAQKRNQELDRVALAAASIDESSVA